MELSSLKLFLRIAVLGGVSRAASDLNLSPASASARLRKLEQSLGFRLFHRTTRAVSLTTDGAEFLRYAEQAIETLDTGLLTVKGQGAEPRGRLRMTLPGSFGRLHVVPHLRRFHEQYPKVILDLRFSDEVLDMVEGAYDLAIRNAALNDSSLIARKLAADSRLLVAAPKYLERFGSPSGPEDLKNHHCVVLSGTTSWKFAGGKSVLVPPSFVVNDGEVMRSLVHQGLAIGMHSHWLASSLLRSGELVQVLPNDALACDTAIWALYPSKHLLSPKVKAMLDFLKALFHPAPPWI